MKWDVIRPGLLALVKALSGLEGTWKDQPQGYIPPTGDKASFTLRVGPPTTKGILDELVQEVDLTKDPGQELQDNATGYRLFTLKIQCESTDQTDGKTADHYLELVRSRLRWTSSTEALSDIGCALVATKNMVDLSTSQDSRVKSIYALDVRLSAQSNERDPSRYGWIETVVPSGP